MAKPRPTRAEKIRAGQEAERQRAVAKRAAVLARDKHRVMEMIRKDRRG
jgi:hypothetical protein